MGTSSRAPAFIFALLLLCVAFPFAVRTWRLRLLFLDAAVRADARSTLEMTTEAQGWLLSDLRLENIDASSLLFVHRDHRRHAARGSCFVVRLRTSRLIPCES